jgi:hypothetical protein
MFFFFHLRIRQSPVKRLPHRQNTCVLSIFLFPILRDVKALNSLFFNTTLCVSRLCRMYTTYIQTRKDTELLKRSGRLIF